VEYNLREVAAVLGSNCQAETADRTISRLLTDSRRVSLPEESLFFALRTKTNNGHKYIEELYRLGVRSFVVSEERGEYKRMDGACFLFTGNTLDALQRLATHHRHRFNLPVVGLAGSNGKTVVKEFLYQLLHRQEHIVRSPRSYNSQTGVPLSVWEIDHSHTLGIFEAGISQVGEMERLQPVIAPTAGIFTHLGEAHQENFGSFREKCLEKLKLFAQSKLIIYNDDEKIVAECLHEAGLFQRAFGWNRHQVQIVPIDGLHTQLSCHFSGKQYDVVIPFTDEASIENVIHCIALLHLLYPDTLTHTENFASLEPVDMRLDIKQATHHSLLINDSYNSDTHSLDIALAFQQSRRTKGLKSTLILSDIYQSGLPAQALYSKVADLVKSRHIERFIGIGTEVSAFANLFDLPQTAFFPSTEAFLAARFPFHHELILLKGARPFRFEEIAAYLEEKVHETILEINLDALVYNFNYHRSHLRPKTKIACMVKAFGYGAGSCEVARTLQEHRCDYLAVAVADEGDELRKAGITIPILVMNPEMSSLNILFDNFLEPEVYSFSLLDALIAQTRRRAITSYPVHLKFDTGMHRLGFSAGDIPAIIERLAGQTGIAVRSCFSHLAGADDMALDAFTLNQLELFDHIAHSLEAGLGHTILKHILNSAGIQRFPNYQMDMVRLGISLYGIPATAQLPLKSVSTLRTIILQIRDVAAGDSIGYSRKDFVTRPSRIAILPVGYADGLDRRLGNHRGKVIIHGNRFPIVGNICMDTCMIDVTDCPAAKEGDAVTIFGDGLSVEEIAAQLETIPYEILTSVSSRVKRIYFREQ
jgi:alanine racemase